jgi:hypothetical protein
MTLEVDWLKRGHELGDEGRLLCAQMELDYEPRRSHLDSVGGNSFART